ncbi:hypothetical protein H072_1825 [Dactylellina haptotyla CBS 200.50]|uniref:Uncharacterized protein n=1 Tax=Dactylellina haptotyla (strain CBS 200.50) TaxID=1284197 RepID=S8AMK2_DACHA|nr:hypothetical protein H072_1825 [Dactylellina haptotyla CBS 200.50]
MKFSQFFTVSVLALGVSAQASNSTGSGTAGISGNSCPTSYNEHCLFLCPSQTVDGSYTMVCSTEWDFSLPDMPCTVCPNVPTSCPKTALPGCAYMCKTRSLNYGPFCYGQDINVFPGGLGAECTPCDPSPSKSTSISTPTPTVERPKPSPTSGASTISICKTTFLGLFFTMTMIFYGL